MLTRKGLVSNSSSSSFILLFKPKPESTEDVCKQVFPNVSSDYRVTCDFYDSQLTPFEASEIIYNDSGVASVSDISSSLNRLFYYYNDHFIYGNQLKELVYRKYITQKDYDLLCNKSVIHGRADKASYDYWRKAINANITEFITKANKSKHDLTDAELHSKAHDAAIPLVESDIEYRKLRKLANAADVAYDKACHKVAGNMITRLKRRGYWIAQIEIGDSHGIINGLMEHGNTFDLFEHIRISNH